MNRAAAAPRLLIEPCPGAGTTTARRRLAELPEAFRAAVADLRLLPLSADQSARYKRNSSGGN